MTLSLSLSWRLTLTCSLPLSLRARAPSVPTQLDQIQPFPGPRSVVLIDNASIHWSAEFLRRIEEKGALLLFTPPYCWDLTPLDNGAFGMVKRWLMDHAKRLDSFQYTTRQALDEAFHEAVSPSAARSFFYECGYEMT